MSIMSIRSIMHDVYIEELQKLGAKVKCFNEDMLFFVTFNIDNVKISYIYYFNNMDNKYYVERIKPYCMHLGDFQTEEEVVNFIKTDSRQFIKVMESKGVHQFNEIYKAVTKLTKAFEDFYIYNNISKEEFNDIKKSMENIKAKFKCS